MDESGGHSSAADASTTPIQPLSGSVHSISNVISSRAKAVGTSMSSRFIATLHPSSPSEHGTIGTSCTEEEITKYLIVGGPDNDGLTFRLEPGEYRFVTGGYEGSGLSMQDVDMDASIHLDNYVEIVLAATSALLLLGAGEMAFPVRNLLTRFRR